MSETLDSCITYDSPVTLLAGVGKVRAAAYAKMGILTLGDLLRHYPRAYENRGDVRLLADCDGTSKCSVILTVSTAPTNRFSCLNGVGRLSCLAFLPPPRRSMK